MIRFSTVPSGAFGHGDSCRVEQAIKAAGFYTPKYLEDFIFDEVTMPVTLSEADLGELTFITNRQNLILYGNVETGKIHLFVVT